MIFFLFLNYFITCGPLCRAPQDINLDSSVMNVPVRGELPKVDKPLSPHAEKTVPESPKPLSPKGTQCSRNAGGAPSPTRAALGTDSVGASSDLDVAESPAPSLGPRSHGLGAPGGYHPGESLSVPRPEKHLRQHSRVEESLFDNP
jgi:hypothetical protein